MDVLSNASILLGDQKSNFNPQTNIKRSEAAKMLAAYIVFDTHPTIIPSLTPLKYTEVEPTIVPEGINISEDDFHKELIASDSHVSWKSASEGYGSTHEILANQGFYILFQDMSYIDNIQGKFSQKTIGYVKNGATYPDSYETENGSAHHYCTPDLKGKWNSSDSAVIRCDNHYYNSVAEFSYGEYQLAYNYLGRAIHYLSDVNSPPHAREIIGGPHRWYEKYVRNNWQNSESDFYTTSASSDTYTFMCDTYNNIFRNFATLSHSASYSCFDVIRGDYVASDSTASRDATRDCFLRTERAIAGMGYRYLIETGRLY